MNLVVIIVHISNKIEIELYAWNKKQCLVNNSVQYLVQVYFMCN